MAKAVKKSKAPAKKKAAVKKVVKVIEEVKPPVVKEIEPEVVVVDVDEVLLGRYPQLTKNDLYQYQGEGRESMLRRVAEKLGISYEELI